METNTTVAGPYKESSTNLIYQMLFCDDLDLYRTTIKSREYPFDILFSETSNVQDLQKIADDSTVDPRIKLLAYFKQRSSGHIPQKTELYAVIVEVGLDEGLDVLASFTNGTARFIHHTGKIIIWETVTQESNKITDALFEQSLDIVNKIGPTDKPRKEAPATGYARMSFLLSDGLYYGEAEMNVLFNDPMASAALTSATHLMQYLTEKSSGEKKN